MFVSFIDIISHNDRHIFDSMLTEKNEGTVLGRFNNTIWDVPLHCVMYRGIQYFIPFLTSNESSGMDM